MVLQVKWAHRVYQVHRDLKDYVVKLVILVCLAQMDLLEKKVKVVHRDPQDLQDHRATRDQRVQLDQREGRDRKARLVKEDPLAPKALQVHQEIGVLQASLEIVEYLVLKELLAKLEYKALLVHQDLLDPRESWEPKAYLVYQGIKVKRAALAELEEEEHEVPEVTRVELEEKAREVVLVLEVQEGVRAILASLEKMGSLAFKEMLELPENKANLVMPGPKDCLDQWEQEDLKDPKEKMVNLALMESLDLRVILVYLVARAHADPKDLWVHKVREV